MNYATIKYCDVANGTGVRTVLFVSGCRLHCPFCFNEAAWNFHAGTPFTKDVEDTIIESLQPVYIDGLSVLGGEPTEPENQEGLVDFMERVHNLFPQKSIWMYTGHTWDQLMPGGCQYTPFTMRILKTLDVLVDGPFIQAQKDITLRFRGSANQRLIDVPQSLAQNRVILWHDDPLFDSHTWD